MSFVRSLKNRGHLVESILANTFYLFPSKKLTIIGVTGTDGKTTTATLIHHLLNKAGQMSSMITTVGAKIGDKVYDTGSHTTTPSAFSLQKYIRKAVSSGSKYLVLEVTSHALDQNRTYGIPFKIGVLTNVTHEHLDYHKTYERYLAAKAKLFQQSKIVVLNRDDSSYYRILDFLKGKEIITYSKDSSAANFNAGSLVPDKEIANSFNLYNFLAAFTVGKILGVNETVILDSFKDFVLPSGRQETVYDGEFKVIIDFAHTPNSFEKILESTRGNNKGRLIHVFGAAGKRDNTKRQAMGRISSKFSDVIILTAEDPRGEPIDKINSEISRGIDKEFVRMDQNLLPESKGKIKLLYRVLDREKAIEFAILNAKKGDVILITGKGHEKSMNLGHGEISWSEHEVVKKALRKRR